MRRFFLLCLFIVCFLVAGELKSDLFSAKFDGVREYELASYVLSDKKDIALVYGQTISTKVYNFDKDVFLSSMGAQSVQSQEVCDRNIIYAYSPKLASFVYVKGVKVNLQISIDEENVRIGYPLIMGSF